MLSGPGAGLPLTDKELGFVKRFDHRPEKGALIFVDGIVGEDAMGQSVGTPEWRLFFFARTCSIAFFRSS